MSSEPSQFEEPILRVRQQIDDLVAETGEDDSPGVAELRQQLERVTREVYSNLTAWQKTLVARNAARPYTLDFVARLFEEFEEIHGDRKFADDPSIVCGLARFGGRGCVVIGHQKGRDTKEKIRRNFGMPRPEGYRKAIRAMRLAEKFRIPVFTLIDTPGAYPGMGAEERGQAEAIAVNLKEMAGLRTPIIVTVTGEGGSGGALALGVGDRVFMLEHSIYSVISPEGCAAILWKDPAAAQTAADAMKITAPHLKELGIIDQVVPEPLGGAQTDYDAAAALLRPWLESALGELSGLDEQTLLSERYAKFRRMGVFETV